MTKVYVEGPDHLLVKMFLEEGFDVVDSLFSADLLCLEGGSDVTPSLYGEKNTDSQNSPSKDIHSLGLITAADLLEIPIVGVCRGSQIMNVAYGGKMIQHVEGHAGPPHTITYDGVEYEVTSAHHQASVPHRSVSTDDVYKAPDGTVEAVIYREERCLGFQPHPEYVGKGHPCRQVFFKMLEEIL